MLLLFSSDNKRSKHQESSSKDHIQQGCKLHCCVLHYRHIHRQKCCKQKQVMAVLNRRRENNGTHRQGGNYRWVYQSFRWHKLSKDHRKRNPLCKRCLDKGLTEKAEVTDHTIPLVIWHGEMGRDPYDSTNLQSLSKSCHSIKTKEDRKT
jgi:hypothetical protein